jgi:hypothetical protein
MTIPDLGHCAGTATPPVAGTARDEPGGERTGLCAVCSGRFELHPTTGDVTPHDAADVDEREPWPESG